MLLFLRIPLLLFLAEILVSCHYSRSRKSKGEKKNWLNKICSFNQSKFQGTIFGCLKILFILPTASLYSSYYVLLIWIGFQTTQKQKTTVHRYLCYTLLVFFFIGLSQKFGNGSNCWGKTRCAHRWSRGSSRCADKRSYCRRRTNGIQVFLIIKLL